MNNVYDLLTCKGSGVPTIFFNKFFINPIERQQISNCYFFKNEAFIFFCENYCEMFHLTKPSTFFDGDIEQLKFFVNYLRENWYKFFANPNNNVLSTINTYEDYLIVQGYTRTDKIWEFFSSATNINLSLYKTDVLYYGGMNVFEGTRGNYFSIDLRGFLEKLTWIFFAIFI